MREIIDETIRAVEQMKRAGVTHVEVSASVLEGLNIGPLTSAGVPTAPREVTQPTTDLVALAAQATACTKCKELACSRKSVVFGVGHPQAELMFIGEAPGYDEDVQGEPFVGRAGQLLTKIIQAMGFARHEVYICNVLKCRPPDNRQPLPDEVANCLPFLTAQIELVKPKLIVVLGATAMKALLDVPTGITKIRGTWYTYRGVPIMPTFHPAYLLRNPPAKKEVWQDMQAVVEKLGRELPAR